MHLPRAARVLFVSAALLAPELLAPSTVMADGNVNLFFGQKKLEKDDWAPLEDQTEFGAETSFGASQWPVHFAVDVLNSSDEGDALGIHLKGHTKELDVGLRTAWNDHRIRPFIGAGTAIVHGKFEGSFGVVSVSDKSTRVGTWIGGGVFLRLGRAFNIGLSVRYSKATLKLFDERGQGGGTHAGILLGWGWPVDRRLPRPPKPARQPRLMVRPTFSRSHP